jgi:CheY-like chemotaxis protein
MRPVVVIEPNSELLEMTVEVIRLEGIAVLDASSFAAAIELVDSLKGEAVVVAGASLGEDELSQLVDALRCLPLEREVAVFALAADRSHALSDARISVRPVRASTLVSLVRQELARDVRGKPSILPH